MRILQYLAVVCLVATCGFGIPAKAQPKLSADLIFVGEIKELPNYETRGIKPILVRINAETGVLEPFYDDPALSDGALYPVSWSPDGALLAIYRVEQINSKDPTETGYLSQICLLTREGKLHTCSQNQTMLPELNPHVEKYINVTWSPDSQRFYFFQRVEGLIQLAEADSRTGETLRTLYDIPYAKNTFAPIVNWTSDLKRLLVTTVDRTIHLNDLQTKQQQELTNLESLGKTDDTRLRVCYDFSPKNTYFAVLAEEGEILRGPTLMNMEGQTIPVLRTDGDLNAPRLGCPSWNKDETAMFFIGVSDNDKGARVFRYSLTEKKLEVFYRLPEASLRFLGTENPVPGAIAGKLAVSPDGKYVAGIAPSNTLYGWQITVVSSDGSFQNFLGEYYSALYPMWVPPQK
jgi:WD40 repeat protein